MPKYYILFYDFHSQCIGLNAIDYHAAIIKTIYYDTFLQINIDNTILHQIQYVFSI